MNKPRDAADRFWEKVQKGDGCWEWQAAFGANGYGKLKCCGRTMAAHRMSWVLANGEIPDGLCVLHKCDNRSCVRPEHLFLGTKKQNTADMWAKGRGSRGGAGESTVRGERHGMAKLTAEQVLEIRKLAADGISLTELCKRFGLKSSGSMSAIVSGKKWAHLDAQEKGAPKTYAVRVEIKETAEALMESF